GENFPCLLLGLRADLLRLGQRIGHPRFGVLGMLLRLGDHLLGLGAGLLVRSGVGLLGLLAPVGDLQFGLLLQLGHGLAGGVGLTVRSAQYLTGHLLGG